MSPSLPLMSGLNSVHARACTSSCPHDPGQAPSRVLLHGKVGTVTRQASCACQNKRQAGRSTARAATRGTSTWRKEVAP